MGRKESEVLNKIYKLHQSLVEGWEKEKYLDQLEKQGQTWNLIHLNGTLLGRGIRGMNMSTGTEDQRLFIQE